MAGVSWPRNTTGSTKRKALSPPTPNCNLLDQDESEPGFPRGRAARFSAGLHCGGGSCQLSLALTVHDVQMVLNYLETRGDLDMSRVGMFGQGSGGAIAVLAAAADSRI